MAKTKKPTDFVAKSVVKGTEELYTQTGGKNRKFTVEQLKNWLATQFDFTEIIYTGGTVYETSEHLSGEEWIDAKPIYRRVIDVPQFTTGGDESGEIVLGAGDFVDTLVSMDVTVEITTGTDTNRTTFPQNYLGLGTLGIDGVFRVRHDSGAGSTKLTWVDVWDSGDVSTSLPKFHVIIRYTKV